MKLSQISVGLVLTLAAPVARADIRLDAPMLLRGGIASQAEIPVSQVPESDPAGSDLIRLENGDLLHGKFGGLNEGLIWKREDIDGPIRFQMKSVRQIIFNGIRGADLSKGTAFTTLVSGDRLPGKIIAMTDKDLTIESPMIGRTTIPRNRVRSLSPSPFGGELFYAGPFTSDGWMRPEHRVPEAEEEEVEVPADEAAEAGEKATEEGAEAEEDPPTWIYSGASFYSVSRGPLVFDAGLPAVGRLRFKATYKAQLNLSIALHADFSHPLPPKEEPEKNEKKAIPGTKDEAKAEALVPDTKEKKKEEEEKPALEFEKLTDLQNGSAFQTIPWMAPGQNSYADYFGNSYVLNVNSNYHNLNRSFFTDEGRGIQSSLTATRSNVSLPQSGEAEIDIRFDRNKNLVMLFIDGKYAVQWTDPSGYFGEGTGIGFLNGSNTRVKISDILVTSWNGIIDEAQSMNHPDRDVALLTNGTDRFSGELTRIEDEFAYLKTTYAEIKIPLGDLSQLELRRTGLADPDAAEFAWAQQPVTVLFKPYGLIKLIPDSSTPAILSGHSPFLGKFSVNLEDAVMLRFLDESPDISDWFDEF